MVHCFLLESSVSDAHSGITALDLRAAGHRSPLRGAGVTTAYWCRVPDIHVAYRLGSRWEGVVGGLLLVALLAAVVAVWRDVSLAVLLPFCLATAAISIVGDLTVSMFKRTAGVKDSGALFPGHGGVLDRVDSVAAAAPLFALGVGWLGLA